MKKVLKSRIFIVIICGIIFTSLGVYGATKYNYFASEILYNETTVEDALNELYNIKTLGDATSEDIIKGKTAVVQGKLVTGTASSSDNIITETISIGASAGKTKTYDATKEGYKIIAFGMSSFYCDTSDDSPSRGTSGSIGLSENILTFSASISANGGSCSGKVIITYLKI